MSRSSILRGHDVPRCDLNRSSQDLNVIEQFLDPDKERFLHERFKILPLDVTLDFQVEYSTHEIMRVIRPFVSFEYGMQNPSVMGGGWQWEYMFNFRKSNRGPLA